MLQCCYRSGSALMLGRIQMFFKTTKPWSVHRRGFGFDKDGKLIPHHGVFDLEKDDVVLEKALFAIQQDLEALHSARKDISLMARLRYPKRAGVKTDQIYSKKKKLLQFKLAKLGRDIAARHSEKITTERMYGVENKLEDENNENIISAIGAYVRYCMFHGNTDLSGQELVLEILNHEHLNETNPDLAYNPQGSFVQSVSEVVPETTDDLSFQSQNGYISMSSPLPLPESSNDCHTTKVEHDQQTVKASKFKSPSVNLPFVETNEETINQVPSQQAHKVGSLQNEPIDLSFMETKAAAAHQNPPLQTHGHFSVHSSPLVEDPETNKVGRLNNKPIVLPFMETTAVHQTHEPILVHTQPLPEACSGDSESLNDQSLDLPFVETNSASDETPPMQSCEHTISENHKNIKVETLNDQPVVLPFVGTNTVSNSTPTPQEYDDVPIYILYVGTKAKNSQSPKSQREHFQNLKNYIQMKLSDLYKVLWHHLILKKDVFWHLVFLEKTHKFRHISLKRHTAMDNAKESHSATDILQDCHNATNECHDATHITHQSHTVTVCQKSPNFFNACHGVIEPQDTIRPHGKMPHEAFNLLCEETVADLQPNREHMRMRDKICNDLQRFLREVYSQRVTLELFGSSKNGFTFCDSDLDICLTFENGQKNQRKRLGDVRRIICEVASNLSKNPSVHKVSPILFAKVPIVKFHLPNVNLDADIVPFNELAIRNTALVATYANIDHRFRCLGYLLKSAMKNLPLSATVFPSSYAYIILVIFFLQQRNPPVLPVLQELYSGSESPKCMVDSWNTWFYKDINKLPYIWDEYGKNHETVGELWQEMLRFYSSEFDFSRQVVSIRRKKRLSRVEKHASLEKYDATQSRHNGKLWQSSHILIEDPFDHLHNISRIHSYRSAQHFKKELIMTLENFP